MARLTAKLGLGVSKASFNNPEHVEDRQPTVTSIAVDVPEASEDDSLTSVVLDTDE